MRTERTPSAKSGNLQRGKESGRAVGRGRGHSPTAFGGSRRFSGAGGKVVPTLHWEKGAPGPGVTASEPPAATAPRQRPREPAGSQSAVREELRTELKTEPASRGVGSRGGHEPGARGQTRSGTFHGVGREAWTSGADGGEPGWGMRGLAPRVS